MMPCGDLQCAVGLANLFCFGALAYITLLLSLYLRCSKARHEDERGLLEGHTTRSVLSVLLLLTHAVELGEVVAGGGSWLCVAAAWAAWAAVQYFYFTIQAYGRPGYLCVSSLLYLCCGLARGVLLYSLLEEVGFAYVAVNTAAASSTLGYAMALNDMATLFNEMKDGGDDEKKHLKREFYSYKHENAHWYSRITFFWLLPLLKMGYKHPLEMEDLGKLPISESSMEQFAYFTETYNRNKEPDKNPSLWKCYFQCYWRNFFIGGILKFLGDMVGFVAPLGIAVIVEYVTNNQVQNFEGKYIKVNDFLRNGYNMAGIIFLSALAQGSFSQASSHIITVEGIRLKTALQALIYDKTLKLSISNKDDDSASEGRVGSTTNLMSEDAFNVMTCFWIGHYTWAIPWKVAVLMYLLYCKLGLSAVIGALFCIIFMTPLQFIIGKKMSNNSKIITTLCDERLRMTNELLQGIKVLKLCGWENEFCVRITSSRKKELKFLDKDSLYWALMTFLTHSSTSLITLVTLGVYYYIEGSSLSPANVFSALALFNQLTVPLCIFPITVPIIISALISTKRLEEFFALQETINILPAVHEPVFPKSSKKNKPDNTTEVRRESAFGLKDIVEETDDTGDSNDTINKEDIKVHKSSVCILRDAGFSWGEEEKPTLWIDKLNIPKGELTAVIGRVGSGKSSFLSALLGEMKSVSGLLKWEKGVSLAYVSQQPWLLNATLRDNILMGLPYKPRRFNRVITATALQPDIDILPLKDLTEIGEKGINLSGGQRQRVAIARALYSKANVIILDDPLSSLDYHVAQHVFEKGILNLVTKQKKTVVMVTHSLHLLTYAHLVVALESGRLKACGKLRDLELVDGVVTFVSEERGKTARERWQLVRLVSRIGRYIRQSGRQQSKPLFIPFHKRLSTASEFFWTGELPLPEKELPLGRAMTLPRHRPVARASSLQPHPSAPPQVCPVTRQASSPTINQGRRSRTYTFDSGIQGGNLLKQIFMTSTKNVQTAPEMPVTGSFKEKNILKRLMSSASIKSVVFNENEKHPIQRLPSTCSDYSDDYCDEEDELDPDWCGTSTTDERQYGKISPYVYLSYIKACGYFVSILYFTLAISWQAFRVYTDFWLSAWTEESSTSEEKTFYYLTMYTGLSLLSVLISLLYNLLGQYCGSQGRKTLHRNMLFSVVRLPISDFEIMPLGRILSRFSTDINIIDKKLATSIQRLLQFLFLCFSAILVNSIVTPWFLIIAIPICIMYYVVQKFYRSSSRELQRLDSMTRTPIISHLTETLSGLETIRAFKQQKRFTAAMLFKIDAHTNAFLISNCATRWLGIALDYLGAVIVLLATLVSLICSWYMPQLITPALVGLAINYTLLLPIYLNWVVKFVSDVEMYMAGVERIVNYIQMPSENYKTNGFIPLKWPARGEIRFEGVTLRYDHSNEIAIHNLTLHIKPGQKVGICGRTGSGKSSLVMSLFGMTPIVEGTILVDGVDISAVPLQILRSRLSIIPQDIIMFSGTIRENLDMEGKFNDEKLWQALEMAQMKETVSTQLGGLDGQVREGGVNLSSGQRQQLCLARAILHNAACLIMDEATSSLDPTTEQTFLNAVEKAFSKKTVVNIAHRLGSLLSCDRIIVLESGRVVEDGTPHELLHRSMGIFSTMLRSTERQEPYH